MKQGAEGWQQEVMLAAVGLTQQQIQHFHMLENVHSLAKQANAVG